MRVFVTHNPEDREAYYGRSLCWKKLGDLKRYRRDQELGRQLRE